MYIEYRSFGDMSKTLLSHLYLFPHHVDVIVGIPRSGMLPATILGLYLNKPVTDIDSFVQGQIYSVGDRGASVNYQKSNRVVVIDDSVSSGDAMIAAKEKLKGLEVQCDFTFATVYTTSIGKKHVDIYCETIDMPRIFQWNLFHEPNLMAKSCMDIDGVLCPDPPVDDDGEKYVNYISNARPLVIPTVEINTLVTCRLEKYRRLTEKWLADNGVKYKKLIMLDLPSREERLKWGKHGEYKAEVYKQSSCDLFVESSLSEALTICNLTNKQVFCIETMEMLHGKCVNLDKSTTWIVVMTRRLAKNLLPQRVIRYIRERYINK